LAEPRIKNPKSQPLRTLAVTMIDETTQDLAVRHVLAELDACQTQLFLEEMARNADLRRFVTELRETAALMALSTLSKFPQREVLKRILAQISGR
jgi:hypothetical protein